MGDHNTIRATAAHQLLAQRLCEHAEIHDQHIPHDDEQAAWAQDLRAAADIISTAGTPHPDEAVFRAAILDLASISEALGLDPDDGGAAPILAAIEQLRAAWPADSAALRGVVTAAQALDEACEELELDDGAGRAATLAYWHDLDDALENLQETLFNTRRSAQAEADRADHLADTSRMVPSDEEIDEAWCVATKEYAARGGYTNDVARFFARVLLSRRYQPAASAEPPFGFDRYINGVLMAEGVLIEKASTLEQAAGAAAQIASRGAAGEVPVLIYRGAAPVAQGPTESVLIDGAAYTIPAPVAIELLRLHIELLQAAPAAQEPARTNSEIVRQTEELARLLMLEIYSRTAPENTLFRNAEDPRGKHCWQLACKAQEILTATDPENSVSELDDAPVADPVAQPAGIQQMKTVAQDVLAERWRQITAEAWTPEHDDAHTDCGMSLAAACYALDAAGYSGRNNDFWPWAPEWWKPGSPRRNLVKAGALILAEIERIDRAAAPAARGE